MFPTGVETRPIVWNLPTALTGGLVDTIDVEVTPILGAADALVWTATGEQLTSLSDTFTGTEGVAFDIPVVDQDGWRDPAGNNFTNWAYKAVATITKGRQAITYEKNFQIKLADLDLDLALVPDGPAGDPTFTPVPPGKSAYEIAVDHGYVGAETDWLTSLHSTVPGPPSTVPGPPNTLTIGTVVEGPVADAVISGTAPSQTLSLMLPQADPGPPNTLAIGTVVEGPTAVATITGTSPSQTLNLVLPEADPGPPNTLTIGTVESGGSPAASITGTSPNQTLNLTLVPGIGVPTTGNNPGDLLRWNGTVWIQTATKFLEGTGNPNGVVTAPVGSTFVNTESGGYNGARRWTKATGSGNTGWVVVDGDTGWRDITTYMSNLAPANAGTVKVKRVGKQVTYAFNNVLLASGTGSLLIYNGVPAGYRPASESNGFAFGYLSRHDNINILQLVFCNTNVIQWRVEQNMNPPITTTTTRPTSGVSGQFTIHTIDDWPTALW